MRLREQSDRPSQGFADDARLARRNGEVALDVVGLSVEFALPDGVLPAVRDISFAVGRGQRVGVVGESGSGKSVTALAILGLIDHPGRISGGQVWFGNKNLVGLSEKQLEKVRGGEIALISQDPMTAWNPV